MRIGPALRISISLCLVTACLLLAADWAGLVPGRERATLEGRKQLCEALAVQFALAIQRGDLRSIETTLALLVERNDELLSAALREADGAIVAEAGDHARLWAGHDSERSTPTHTLVPIFRGAERWGHVEVRFEPLRATGLAGALANPLLRLIGFVMLLGLLSYGLFMRRILRHLDPSAVVPARVKTALDMLSEGVVLCDAKEQIVLANRAFCERAGRPENELVGRPASQLPWADPETGEPAEDFPWVRAMAVGEPHTGTSLALANQSGPPSLFVVNGAPIIDGKKLRGVLATFDDVTELEATNVRLRKTLNDLEQSREEVEKQNDKLQFLAAHDPLTGLLNRRSFFERFEHEFDTAREAGKELSLIMCDIDHFKSFNDTHGHAVGDQVIQAVSETLRATLRENDQICRYGGEEFCIALPGTPLETAVAAAERVRKALADRKDIWGRVTGSFGASSLLLDAETPAELIDQADQALYAAKQSGRNRVCRWDVVMGVGTDPELPTSLGQPVS